MKKIILTLAVIACSFTFAKAQDNAIGLRFTNGAEVSYQRLLGSSNRLEVNLGLEGFSFDPFSLNVSGTYQWVWDLSALAPGFNWYAGVGASVGMAGDIFSVGVHGNIGIEYNLKSIPLAFSLDYRPGYVLPFAEGAKGAFYYEGVGFAVRYKF
jgi:hypothetical protein